MAIKAVLFDLDNTLYAYDPCNESALRFVCTQLSEVSAIEWQSFRALHDDVRRDLAKRLKHQAASHNRAIFFKEIVARHLGRLQPRLAVDLNQAYWREFYRHMRLEADATRVLTELQRKFRLAIVSNHTTEIQLEKIDRLGIARYFDHIVTSEEAGVEKPDPAIFDFALSRLGVHPGEAAMVGDHPSGDVGGAKNAGILAIHTRQFVDDRAIAAGADHMVDRLAEVLSILQPS